MKPITPFLWFNTNAEEAVNFYTSVFKNSKPGMITRNGDSGPGPKGSVLVATFWINGQEFIALNGGPTYTFNEAISFVANCETQQEIDELWEKLSAGGEKRQCGWLKDKFGISWQVIPYNMGVLMNAGGPEKSNRAMAAMMKMTKIDIKALENA